QPLALPSGERLDVNPADTSALPGVSPASTTPSWQRASPGCTGLPVPRTPPRPHPRAHGPSAPSLQRGPSDATDQENPRPAGAAQPLAPAAAADPVRPAEGGRTPVQIRGRRAHNWDAP